MKRRELTGKNRSIWKSHESERRLREPMDGRRERSAAESSSAPPPPPPRLNFPEVTIPGFANKILGAGDGFEELLPPLPAIIRTTIQ